MDVAHPALLLLYFRLWRMGREPPGRLRSCRGFCDPIGHRNPKHEKKTATLLSKGSRFLLKILRWGDRGDLNPRPSESQSDALTN